MEKKGKYTIAAHLPGFFRKKGKGILPLHNGGKRNLRGGAVFSIPLPALYIKKTVPRLNKILRKFGDFAAAE